MDNSQVYSVSDINQWVKGLIESDRRLSDVYVKGELSNYKVYPSGHHYFTLKDESCVLRSVMFRGEAAKLSFRPESGMKVIVRGRISVYPRDGQYQLYASEMIAEGAGALYLAYEQLKKKLAAKGYFDESAKKPLPKYPERICIITSSAGAAIRDMLRILKKRWPVSEVLLVPVRVQGEEAPGEIVAALDYANLHDLGDIIITGRGGGSIEDLWAFNDERVADAIYRSRIPVISAVGHEPDVTIADFVADLRAATPSNAAELAVPDMAEIMNTLSGYEARLKTLLERQVMLMRRRYQNVAESRALSDPMGYINDRRQALDSLQNVFSLHISRHVDRERAKYAKMAATLDALSPFKVLGRGYLMASVGSGKKKKALKSVNDTAKGDSVNIRLKDGELDCLVNDVKAFDLPENM